jgi:hypothetical protein
MPLLNTIGGASIRSYGRGRGGGAAGLYLFTDATFTPGGVTGATGPSLVNAITGLTGTGVSVWENDTNFFNTSNGIQLWTVPADGDYRIETWGARGGGGSYGSYAGGYGSRMRGDFTLTSGDVMKILVGQRGGGYYGGGGGMTAVATSANTPLIVSGGGNNQTVWNATLSHAPTTTTGVAGYGVGGTSGGGGYGTAGAWGGAGFTGNPTGTDACSATAPLSFTNGGTGGTSCNAIGSFGGGSATDGCCYGASAAGGGYSGGGGTSGSMQYGGAGGSYNNGTNQSNSAGNTTGAQINGPGICTITKLP